MTCAEVTNTDIIQPPPLFTVMATNPSQHPLGQPHQILRPGGRKQSSRLVPDNNDTKIKQWTKRLGLKWPGTSPFYHVVAMVKVCLL
jgi:hypothetical protein